MYDGENGFVIGGVDERADVGQQDAADAQALFDLLERTILPMFYNRAEGPFPRRWLERVRRSIATLGPRVLATRMVVQYATNLYAPIAERARRLTADGNQHARALAAWRGRLNACWDGVSILEATGDEDAAEIGDRRELCVTVRLGALAPDDVQVELLHGAVRADGLIPSPKVATLTLNGEAPPVDRSEGVYRYRGSFDLAVSGEYGLTVRIVPHHEDLTSWADTGLVAWADETTLMADGR
jgi:glycogen phosphorylase